eukprot:1205-Pelagococcus_subviridis.AAC.3
MRRRRTTLVSGRRAAGDPPDPPPPRRAPRRRLRAPRPRRGATRPSRPRPGTRRNTITRSSSAATRLSPSSNTPGGNPERLRRYSGRILVPRRAVVFHVPAYVASAASVKKSFSSGEGSVPAPMRPDVSRSAEARNSRNNAEASMRDRALAWYVCPCPGPTPAFLRSATERVRRARSTAAARCSCSWRLCVPVTTERLCLGCSSLDASAFNVSRSNARAPALACSGANRAWSLSATTGTNTLSARCRVADTTSADKRPNIAASRRFLRSSTSCAPRVDAAYLAYGKNVGASRGSAHPTATPSASSVESPSKRSPSPPPIRASEHGPALKSSTAYRPLPNHAAVAPSEPMYRYRYTYPPSESRSSSGVSDSGGFLDADADAAPPPGSSRGLSRDTTKSATGSTLRESLGSPNRSSYTLAIASSTSPAASTSYARHAPPPAPPPPPRSVHSRGGDSSETRRIPARTAPSIARTCDALAC